MFDGYTLMAGRVSRFRVIDGRVYREDKRINNGKVRVYLNELYTKKNGDLFSLPIDDADSESGDAARSCISRTVGSNLGPRNRYEMKKGMKPTVRADVDAYFAKIEANEARANEIKRLKNPVEMEKIKAQIRAEENTKALDSIVKANAHQAQKVSTTGKGG